MGCIPDRYVIFGEFSTSDMNNASNKDSLLRELESNPVYKCEEREALTSTLPLSGGSFYEFNAEIRYFLNTQSLITYAVLYWRRKGQALKELLAEFTQDEMKNEDLVHQKNDAALTSFYERLLG